MSLKNIVTSMVVLLGVSLTACGGEIDGKTSSTAPTALRVIDQPSGGCNTSNTGIVEVVGKITTIMTGPNLGLSNGPTTWYITTKCYDEWGTRKQSTSAFGGHEDGVTRFALFGHTQDDVERNPAHALVITAVLQSSGLLASTPRESLAHSSTEIALGFGRPFKEMYYAPNSRSSVEITKLTVKDGFAHIIGNFSGELRQSEAFRGIININGQFDVKLPAE